MESSLSLTDVVLKITTSEWAPKECSSIKKIYILHVEKKNVIRSTGKYKIAPFKIHLQILSILVVQQNLKTSIIFFTYGKYSATE